MQTFCYIDTWREPVRLVLFCSHESRAQKVTFFIRIALWQYFVLPSRITLVANSPLLRIARRRYHRKGLNNGNTANTTITAATALSLRHRRLRSNATDLAVLAKALRVGRLRGIEIPVCWRCSGFGCLLSLTLLFFRG